MQVGASSRCSSQLRDWNLHVLCLLYWQAGFFTLVPTGKPHCIRYIAKLTHFPENILLRTTPSIFLELLWSGMRKGFTVWFWITMHGWQSRYWPGPLSSGGSAGLGDSPVFKVGSLSWLCGRPQYLTSRASLQVTWETASFPQGQWPQRGRRNPLHQVWLGHTLSFSHVYSLEMNTNCTLSGEDLGSNVWREECGRHRDFKTIKYRKTLRSAEQSIFWVCFLYSSTSSKLPLNNILSNSTL